jgi:hypothetical protein
MIFTKQAKQNPKTKAIFAPGQAEDGSYTIYKLCSNYDGQVRGGIRKTWRYTNKGLTLDQAKVVLEKKVGLRLWS